MKRSLSLLVAAGLTIGAFSLTGCEPNNQPGSQTHEALFGVGAGEFGTTTTIAGDYPTDLRQLPATQPSASAQ